MKTKINNRREFIKKSVKAFFFIFISSVFLKKLIKLAINSPSKYVWQIDPAKCTQCGKCATSCVINPSAVKCVHQYEICGYCNLCFGYFQPGTKQLTQDAYNQLCPTGAIKRKFIEEPYFEYSIDKNLCIGCGKCVKGCNLFGNGSLYLQVDQTKCLGCNDCNIARNCAGNAFKKVPVKTSYIKKIK